MPRQNIELRIRRQDSPTGPSRWEEFVLPVAAEHERDLVPRGDPQEPGHQAGPEDDARALGVVVPRESAARARCS